MLDFLFDVLYEIIGIFIKMLCGCVILYFVFVVIYFFWCLEMLNIDILVFMILKIYNGF